MPLPLLAALHIFILFLQQTFTQATTTNIPSPTPDQLIFQDMEIGALISYNMATAAHTQGCAWNKPPPAASIFTGKLPSKINTDQWCAAISSFGGKYATLVAKHLCGFTLWPSKAKSGNYTFDYSTNSIGIDIVQQLAESCNAVGVKLGIYYSVNVNALFNVQNGVVQPFIDPNDPRPRISQAQYVDIVQQQLRELWTNYGPLAEIWFDGGFNVPGMKNSLLKLYNETQQHAAVFNGCGLTDNAVLWIGSESGHAPYPVWNTDNTNPCPTDGGPGIMNGSSYIPKEVDLTLQNSDTWFFQDGRGYRSLLELVRIYHDSVGHGGNMLLNLAPPHNSTLPDDAMELYSKLGKFTASCYGVGAVASLTSLASTSCYSNSQDCHHIQLQSSSSSSSRSIDSSTSIAIDSSISTMTFDRILLKEEMSKGQLITEFEIILNGTIKIFNGTAVGRSLIVLLKENVTAAQVMIRVTASKASPSFRLITIPNPLSCVVDGGTNSDGCNLQQDIVIGGFPSNIPVQTVTTVSQCCAACVQASLQCVAFTAVPTTNSSNGNEFECTLLKATGGSSKTVPGAFSGSPN